MILDLPRSYGQLLNLQTDRYLGQYVVMEGVHFPPYLVDVSASNWGRKAHRLLLTPYFSLAFAPRGHGP